MTKSELVKHVVEKSPLRTSKEIDQAVRALLDQMIDTLSTNNRIEIRGFGSFSIRWHEPKVARNPQNGKNVELDGRHVAHFKPGKPLRVGVNNP